MQTASDMRLWKHVDDVFSETAVSLCVPSSLLERTLWVRNSTKGVCYLEHQVYGRQFTSHHMVKHATVDAYTYTSYLEGTRRTICMRWLSGRY